VLLPAFWSQVFSIEGVRAYELERCRRTHRAIVELDREGAEEVEAALRQWPGYRPRSGWLGGPPRRSHGPWLRRSPS
jgi:hypothetical protein